MHLTCVLSRSHQPHPALSLLHQHGFKPVVRYRLSYSYLLLEQSSRLYLVYIGQLSGLAPGLFSLCILPMLLSATSTACLFFALWQVLRLNRYLGAREGSLCAGVGDVERCLSHGI